MRRRTDGADGDSLAFQLGNTFSRRPGNEHVERPIEPAHDGLDREALDRRNRGSAGDS